MTKPKLIVWGGFWEERRAPLALDEINSHASVSCYFLSHALETYFDVAQISSFLDAEHILDHPSAVAALSTFQAGFTRLGQERPKTFAAIKRGFGGPLASIIDIVSFQRYWEDILFTVIPPRTTLKDRIKQLRAGAAIHHIGWCADPAHCRPREKDDVFTVFLDHGHYAEDDYTHLFIAAMNTLAGNERNLPVRVFIQGNQGIEEWPLGQPWHEERYQRASKVPWIVLQDHYGRSDLFCVTHRESAGLGVIEAAMSGATIVIPDISTPFISPDLIATGLPHLLANGNAGDIARVITIAIEAGVDRQANHARLAQSHSWHVAANNIARALQ